MGLRFRKSVKLAPGVKLNLGKKSAGISIGGKHGGVSFNSRSGARARVSAPGTGLSYSTKIGGSSDITSTKSSSKSNTADNTGGGCLITCLKLIGILILLGAFLQFGWIAGIIWFIFFRKKLDDDPKKQTLYTIVIAILSALSLLFMIGSIGASNEPPTVDTESTMGTEIDSEENSNSSEMFSTQDTEINNEENTQSSVPEQEINTESNQNNSEQTPEPQPTPEPESETTTPAPVPVPVPDPEPTPEPEPEKEEPATSSERYAVNCKNGKIHVVGDCSATGTGSQAMTDAAYFDTYEEALEYSEQIAPDLEKRNCGNCW